MKRIANSQYYITEKGVVLNKHLKHLKLEISNAGYHRVALTYDDGVVKKESVHRLVALYYIPNPEGKSQVNHIDGNKLNNNSYNLEWVTPSENYEHAFSSGLITAKGEEHYLSKYSEAIIIEACELMEQGSRNIDISKRLGINKSLVSMIRQGKAWRHISKNYKIAIRRSVRVSDDTVMWVCEQIEKGLTNKEIKDISIGDSVTNSLLHGIRHRKTYLHISKNYTF